MRSWTESRSWTDCHTFINCTSSTGCVQQVYTDSLMLLALLMIHRTPLSLIAKSRAIAPPLQFAAPPQFNACNEISKHPPAHPRGHLLHPLPHPPPTTPPQTVRRRGGGLRHLQHRLHVHQVYEVRQGQAVEGEGRPKKPAHGAKPATSAPPSARNRVEEAQEDTRRVRPKMVWLRVRFLTGVIQPLGKTEPRILFFS